MLPTLVRADCDVHEAVIEELEQTGPVAELEAGTELDNGSMLTVAAVDGDAIGQALHRLVGALNAEAHIGLRMHGTASDTSRCPGCAIGAERCSRA
ncbi:MAG TPA: hypothetical protein VKT77_06955 [Chthonomonadaceae bacterium]|nr:hypothetical protein [Chthonomonadaceae bacterium]